MSLLKKICPICALVSLVWLTMLVAKWFGHNVNSELLALLMGGSAVGISYALANKLSSRTKAWKLIAIPVSLVAMYTLLHFAWGYFLLATGAYLFAWWRFRTTGIGPIGGQIISQSEVDINKELKNCC